MEFQCENIYSKCVTWSGETKVKSVTLCSRCSRPLFLSMTFCRRWEILLCGIKVADEKLWKKCCRQQKMIDSFSLFKRDNALARFSDRQPFLIDDTKYVSVHCCQNSHRSQKVVDKKMSSTRKSCRPTTSDLVCLQTWQRFHLCSGRINIYLNKIDYSFR